MKYPTILSPFLVAALAALCACDGTRADAEPAVQAAQAPAVQGKSYPLVVREGDAAMFTVTAAGAGPVSYQWRYNGVDIAGATEPKYVVAAALLADDGARYSVKIGSAHGGVVTDVGELLVVERQAAMPWL